MGTELAGRIAAVRARLDAAAAAAGRDPREVRLLLAVKGQDVATIRAALAAGARLLGHNRAQELTATAPALATLPHEVHFIGHLQSNKVGAVLPWVTCVESVDGLALARRLDRAAAAAARTLDVLVQVNTSGEATKYGIAPAAAPDLAAAVGELAHLRLCGFMTIGALSPDRGVVRRSFTDLAAVREVVRASGAPGTGGARELSMGMSGDLEDAVAAGSTIVRVGSAVFGPRPGAPI
jgi:pyridoxal phosphate enzyme (YggS family)